MKSRRLRPSSLIIVAVFFITLSMLVIGAFNAIAADGVAIKDGERVLMMKDGRMFVILSDAEGGVITLNTHISTFQKVRYPEEMEYLVVQTSDIYQLHVQGYEKED